MSSEQVDGYYRNRWPDVVGISGRMKSELVAGYYRNAWSGGVGIHTEQAKLEKLCYMG